MRPPRCSPACQPPPDQCGVTMAGKAPALRPATLVVLGVSGWTAHMEEGGVCVRERLTLRGQPEAKGEAKKAGHTQIKIQCMYAPVYHCLPASERWPQ